MEKQKMKRRLFVLLCIILITALFLGSCEILSDDPYYDPSDQPEVGGSQSDGSQSDGSQSSPVVTLEDIPAFDGKTPYVEINRNIPFFENEDTSKSYETYSELDSLGRCGVAISCIGKELLPAKERGSIGQVKPSGWHTVKYDVVDGKYLYNRCHLIGYQLTAENANTKNLITGTRYMNVTGMLPFENMVADYLKENPDNHVLYRVTPIYNGTNLVASGVLMEAKSVEDNGEDILFCVYVYNAQPGITIDYATGKSCLSGENPSEDMGGGTEELPNPEESEKATYVLNMNSRKFHKESCRYASSIKEENKATYTGFREDLILEGYDPCGTCKP